MSTSNMFLQQNLNANDVDDFEQVPFCPVYSTVFEADESPVMQY